MIIFTSIFACLVFLQYLPIYSPIYHLVVKFIMGFVAGYLSFLCPLFSMRSIDLSLWNRPHWITWMTYRLSAVYDHLRSALYISHGACNSSCLQNPFWHWSLLLLRLEIIKVSASLYRSFLRIVVSASHASLEIQAWNAPVLPKLRKFS